MPSSARRQARAARAALHACAQVSPAVSGEFWPRTPLKPQLRFFHMHFYAPGPSRRNAARAAHGDDDVVYEHDRTAVSRQAVLRIKSGAGLARPCRGGRRSHNSCQRALLDARLVSSGFRPMVPRTFTPRRAPPPCTSPRRAMIRWRGSTPHPPTPPLPPPPSRPHRHRPRHDAPAPLEPRGRQRSRARSLSVRLSTRPRLVACSPRPPTRARPRKTPRGTPSSSRSVPRPKPSAIGGSTTATLVVTLEPCAPCAAG